MKILKSKYFIALLVAVVVMVVYQMVRIARAQQAAAILGMIDYDYGADPSFDPNNAESWDGYETGTGRPPGK